MFFPLKSWRQIFFFFFLPAAGKWFVLRFGVLQFSLVWNEGHLYIAFFPLVYSTDAGVEVFVVCLGGRICIYNNITSHNPKHVWPIYLH